MTPHPPTSRLPRAPHPEPSPAPAQPLPSGPRSHLSMSPRQRARPQNRCRSRSSTWASPSSEGVSSASTPGPSYCTGAARKHRDSALRGPSSVPFLLPRGRGRTQLGSPLCCLPRPPQLPPAPRLPAMAPTRLCSLVQGPQQAVQRGQQAVQLLLPALRVLQALGEAGP